MDFVSGLPKTTARHDSVWVIVDRLTKSAHFLPIKTTHTVDKLAELYIKEIVRLHGVPSSIVFYRDTRFTSRFWKRLQENLGTRLKFSTVFTRKLMVKANERSKCWKICSELVFQTSRAREVVIFH